MVITTKHQREWTELLPTECMTDAEGVQAVNAVNIGSHCVTSYALTEALWADDLLRLMC